MMSNTDKELREVRERWKRLEKQDSEAQGEREVPRHTDYEYVVEAYESILFSICGTLEDLIGVIDSVCERGSGESPPEVEAREIIKVVREDKG